MGKKQLKLPAFDCLDTPCYIFDVGAARDRLDYIKTCLGNIPVTYSVKANPFIMGGFIDKLSHVEVCSPGELEICKGSGIHGDRIIYSGVNKEVADITEAMSYGVDIVTIESLLQAGYVQEAAGRGNRKQKVILRLSSGNQFGMSEEDLDYLVSHSENYPGLDFLGLHYYSGTQKRKAQTLEDLSRLGRYIDRIHSEYGYSPALVEVGLGLPSFCFSDSPQEKEEEALAGLADAVRDFAARYPLGIELGRYIASPCGTYVTTVKDTKVCGETRYAICDGGIHHLKYYGQTMAMQIPGLDVSSGSEKKELYCICGSLCTVADVLVREVELPALSPGDTIMFHECGAYSVTEACALFLSRDLPSIYTFHEKTGLRKVRGAIRTSGINCASADLQ